MKRKYRGADGQLYTTVTLGGDDESECVNTYNGTPLAKRGSNWRAYDHKCPYCYLNQSHTVAMHDARTRDSLYGA